MQRSPGIVDKQRGNRGLHESYPGADHKDGNVKLRPTVLAWYCTYRVSMGSTECSPCSKTSTDEVTCLIFRHLQRGNGSQVDEEQRRRHNLSVIFGRRAHPAVVVNEDHNVLWLAWRVTQAAHQWLQSFIHDTHRHVRLSGSKPIPVPRSPLARHYTARG